jgi:hypothetical protein
LTASAFKVDELMSDDTLSKKVKKLLAVGVAESGAKKGRRTLYRVRPGRLQELVREQFPDFVAYNPWESAGIANPQSADKNPLPKRDSDRSLFVRAQEEAETDVEVEPELEPDNTLALPTGRAGGVDAAVSTDALVARGGGSEVEEQVSGYDHDRPPVDVYDPSEAPPDDLEPLVAPPLDAPTPDVDSGEQEEVDIAPAVAALVEKKRMTELTAASKQRMAAMRAERGW